MPPHIHKARPRRPPTEVVKKEKMLKSRHRNGGITEDKKKETEFGVTIFALFLSGKRSREKKGSCRRDPANVVPGNEGRGHLKGIKSVRGEGERRKGLGPSKERCCGCQTVV